MNKRKSLLLVVFAVLGGCGGYDPARQLEFQRASIRQDEDREARYAASRGRVVAAFDAGNRAVKDNDLKLAEDRFEAAIKQSMDPNDHAPHTTMMLVLAWFSLSKIKAAQGDCAAAVAFQQRAISFVFISSDRSNMLSYEERTELVRNNFPKGRLNCLHEGKSLAQIADNELSATRATTSRNYVETMMGYQRSMDKYEREIAALQQRNLQIWENEARSAQQSSASTVDTLAAIANAAATMANPQARGSAAGFNAVAPTTSISTQVGGASSGAASCACNANHVPCLVAAARSYGGYGRIDTDNRTYIATYDKLGAPVRTATYRNGRCDSALK